MVSKFESQQNKAMIWDLLYNEHAFDNISPSKKNEVKTMFENCFLYISQTSPSESLIHNNKKVVEEIMKTLHTFSVPSTPPAPPVHILPNAIQPQELKALSKPMSEFQKNIEKHKHDLDTQMNPTPPQKPSFSESVDEPLGDKMDQMLSTMIQDRKLQTNQVIKTYTSNKDSTHKWIKSGGVVDTKEPTHTAPIHEDSTHDPNKKKSLKIQENIILPENNIQVIPTPTYIPFQNNEKIAFEISSQRLSHSNKNTSLEIHEELTNIKKRLEHLEKNKIHALEIEIN